MVYRHTHGHLSNNPTMHARPEVELATCWSQVGRPNQKMQSLWRIIGLDCLLSVSDLLCLLSDVFITEFRWLMTTALLVATSAALNARLLLLSFLLLLTVVVVVRKPHAARKEDIKFSSDAAHRRRRIIGLHLKFKLLVIRRFLLYDGYRQKIKSWWWVKCNLQQA